MKFEKGQWFQNDDCNLFIKGVYNGVVKFIEGTSPSAIHCMQELEVEYLEEHINLCEYKLIGEF